MPAPWGHPAPCLSFPFCKISVKCSDVNQAGVMEGAGPGLLLGSLPAPRAGHPAQADSGRFLPAVTPLCVCARATRALGSRRRGEETRQGQGHRAGSRACGRTLGDKDIQPRAAPAPSEPPHGQPHTPADAAGVKPPCWSRWGRGMAAAPQGHGAGGSIHQGSAHTSAAHEDSSQRFKPLLLFPPGNLA